MRRMISDNQLNSLKAPDVIITGVPESAVQGTLTQEQIERLLANDKSRIIFNNEYYYLNDKFHKNGVLTYTHSGYDETGIDKYLNITVTTRDWVLTETNIGGGGSEDFKIIKLDGGITSTVLTQEQIDIMFPKDEQGNIYKPEYNIIITAKDIWSTDTTETYYLERWSPTRITFNSMLMNSYYSCYMGPNSNKFTRETTRIPALCLHNLYIKTNELYIFLSFTDGDTGIYTSIPNSTIMYDKSVACSGYVHTGSSGVITSIKYNPIDQKYYCSLNGDVDYIIFTDNDVIEFTDNRVIL